MHIPDWIDRALCGDCMDLEEPPWWPNHRQRCELLVWYCFGRDRPSRQLPALDCDLCCAVASFFFRTIAAVRESGHFPRKPSSGATEHAAASSGERWTGAEAHADDVEGEAARGAEEQVPPPPPMHLPQNRGTLFRVPRRGRPLSPAYLWPIPGIPTLYSECQKPRWNPAMFSCGST